MPANSSSNKPRSSIQSKFSSMGKDVMIFGIGQYSTVLLQFLLIPIYTRYLTPADYGIISTLNVLSFSFQTVYLLQQKDAVMRFYYDYEEGDPRREVFLSTSYYSVMILGYSCTAVMMIFGKWLFAPIADNIPFSPYVLLMLPVPILQTLYYLPMAVFQVRRQALKYTLFSLLRFSLITAFILYFVVVRLEGAEGRLRGGLIGNFIAAMIMLLPTIKHLRPVFSWENAKKTLAFGIPMIPLGLATWLTNAVNRLILVEYHGNASAGVFNISFMLAHFVEIAVNAVNQVWMPYFFRAVKDENERDTAVPRLATYFLAFGCVIIAAISLFCKEITILITAKGYYEAYKVVPIIAAGFIFRVLINIDNAIIMQVKKTGRIAGIVFATFAVNLVANFLLIPKYNMYGAAWTITITIFFQSMLTHYYATRLFPIKFEIKRVVILIVVTFGIVLASIQIATQDISLQLFAMKIGICVAGALVLFVLGWFHPGEIQAIKRFLRIAK